MRFQPLDRRRLEAVAQIEIFHCERIANGHHQIHGQAGDAGAGDGPEAQVAVAALL